MNALCVACMADIRLCLNTWEDPPQLRSGTWAIDCALTLKNHMMDPTRTSATPVQPSIVAARGEVAMLEGRRREGDIAAMAASPTPCKRIHANAAPEACVCACVGTQSICLHRC